MESFAIHKLILVAKRCKKLAVAYRTRISLKRGGRCRASESSQAQKGYFVVYTLDNIRFAIPLVYVNNKIFRKLLQMSEEEFGQQDDGPLTLPCDACFREHLIMLIQQGATRNLERALLLLIGSSQCHPPHLSAAFHEEQRKQRLLVCNRLVKQSCS